MVLDELWRAYFPSFSEGLSLRPGAFANAQAALGHFPSFSEGLSLRPFSMRDWFSLPKFPFLFGGTFIEARAGHRIIQAGGCPDFPSFSEGLSLRRGEDQGGQARYLVISLPFRRDFH